MSGNDHSSQRNDTDPSRVDYQFLENLSTAYWQSEVFFTALDLKLFDLIESGENTTQKLCEATKCKVGNLCRLLKVMKKMELIGEYKGNWFNTQVAMRYLIRKSPSYMGDFFLYRRNMQENFRFLTQKISEHNDYDAKSSIRRNYEDNYIERNFNYVRALDQLAKQKAKEILEILSKVTWTPPVIDIGGGAGTLCRFLVASVSGTDPKKPINNLYANDLSEVQQDDPYDEIPGVLLDIPEVIDAAHKIYPYETDWKGIKTIAADFRFHEFKKVKSFGLIVMSNFLHAYGETEARRLCEKALCLLKPGGKILIHDYFPDRMGRMPQKGAIYDIAMMLNTYEGKCHEASTVISWIRASGISQSVVVDLETDSSVIIAGEKLSFSHLVSLPLRWAEIAISEGFRQAVPISTEKIVTAPWVRMKCRFGCDEFGKNLQCPPNAMDYIETARLLSSYKWALLLEGTPPGRQFHKLLLRLEKKAFLGGLYKAFVLGAGPCTVCRKCPGVGECKRRDLARPSMEASGIDVFQTARQSGLHLEPVREKGQYVKYIGLLLLE